MSGLNIEGDLSQISDQQLKNISGLIEKLGYTNVKVSIQPLGKAGDGYIANTKRITIEDGKGGTLNIIVKVAPTIEHQRNFFQTPLLFRNEHIMYTKILPKFTQLEIAAGIPPEDRLRYAKCYGSSDDAPNEVILLEDLNDSNFKMLNKLEPLNNECVKMVLKDFARLHSLSYALKHKEPAVWDETKNDFNNVWAVMSSFDHFKAFNIQTDTSAINLVESDVHKRALKGAVTNGFKELSKLASYEGDTKHAVIQHGDCWTNNVMFRFDGEDVKDCIMIDYQASKPTSPVADIMFLIFICTNYEQRREYFYDWIDYYHSELDKALSYHGLKASFWYPKDQLEADLKRYSKAMFGLSIFFTAVLSVNEEEAANFKEAVESEGLNNLDNGGVTNIESQINFKKRLGGLVDSFIDLGLL